MQWARKIQWNSSAKLPFDVFCVKRSLLKYHFPIFCVHRLLLTHVLWCTLVEICLTHKDTHGLVRKHAYHSAPKQDVAWFNHTWSGLLWCFNDDVIKWKHLRVNGHLCEEFTGARWIPGPVNSPRQWRGPLMFSLICVWINGWLNTREAGDLRRYRAHHDVTVMHWTWHAVANMRVYKLQCISFKYMTTRLWIMQTI